MYRTATLSVFDVLDTIHINAVVTEYDQVPGTAPPARIVYSATVLGVGEPDVSVWLWKALQALQAELDQQ